VSEEPAARPWWAEAVFYQIYPRSFCLADPDGRRERLAVSPGSTGAPGRVRDGSGDLQGIRRHLDHLAWLGVDAIWLSPFQPSPMADFGYDVSDYCGVDPLFGTLDDFDQLLADAHELGLRVIVDWVPNHTSDRHPWFVESRSSRGSPRRDWYVWRDGAGPDGTLPPNNWARSFGEGPAWTHDDATGQWYLHLFLPEQPDLDWSNPEVRQAMEGVLGFWLDRGVDGFRIDVVHCLGKDPALPDAPAGLAFVPWSAQNDDERTHPILRRLRSLLDARPHQPVSVGEVFLLDTKQVAPYARPDELHLAFNFSPMFCGFDAGCFRRRVEEAEEYIGGAGGWPTWVLSSHDRPRHRTRFGGSERAARAAAVLLLTLRGTPFIFAGEELGQEDAQVPQDLVVDPGGRDGCRAPLPWDGTPDHGWSLDGASPWLPWPPEAATRNMQAQHEDPTSITHLYRRLLELRRGSPALRRGTVSLVDAPRGVLAYERRERDDVVFVAVNFSGERCHVDMPGEADGTVLVTSAGEGAANMAGARFTGGLGPEEAVVVLGG
jgi:alpha-glucosidase